MSSVHSRAGVPGVQEGRLLNAMTRDKVHPVDHGVQMYDVMRGQGMSHEAALFRAIVLACTEERGRCVERCEELAVEIRNRPKPSHDDWSDDYAYGSEKAGEAISRMPPPNLDWKTGILR